MKTHPATKDDRQISEKFSETASPKRKRGRPRAFTPDFEHFLTRAQLLCEVDTERTHLNRKYFHHAFAVLMDAPNPERFRYLVPDTQALIDGKEKFPRKSIMVELGHLDNNDMIEMAEIVCQERWPTNEAVRRIRAWRFDKPIIPEATLDELSELVYRAIERYTSNHDGVTREMLLGACEDAIDLWDDEGRA